MYTENRAHWNEPKHEVRPSYTFKRVAETARTPAESSREVMLTTQELAEKLNVSTKTISRWRKQGLVSRRFFSEGRPRIGFAASSIERFITANSDRVRRASEFSQLTQSERREIVEQAREAVEAGCWPTEVIRRLARRTGRSTETVRYILKQYDREHPESAICPECHGPMSSQTQQKIYRLHCHGDSVEALSKRFRRSKASIQQVVSQMRAQRIMELPLDYIPSEEFAEDLSPKAERQLLVPMPEAGQPTKRVRPPQGLPPYLASLYEVPLLTREQEWHLFRRMNYLKYKAAQLRGKLNAKRPQRRLMDRIETLYSESVTTKNQIMRANLRLVVSIAKRHIGPTVDFFELVSDGNMSLIRAVEKFDYSRGNKFSTYATWAIMKNFARSIPGQLRHNDRFRTGQEEFFSATEDVRSDEQEQETVQLQREAQVEGILHCLSRREQEIIVMRFGLDRDREPQTLKEIGANLGVSKERIRQLESRALHRLRAAADERSIALL